MLRSNVLLFMNFLSFFFFQYRLQDIWFPASWKVQNTEKSSTLQTTAYPVYLFLILLFAKIANFVIETVVQRF